MTKSTITRERLQEIADDGFLKHGESKVLARMALAAMDSEQHTDDELSNLLWYSQEATCHSDPNYYCEFQRLATPGLIAGIIRELQERRKAYSEPVASVNCVTAEHRRVIEMLLTVCGAAFELADDSCQQDFDGEECHVVPDDAFQKLSYALDEIENTLPTEDTDRPDVFLVWSAVPRAALKSILHAQPAPVVPVVPDELLKEYLRLVQCMLSDYRDGNHGDARRWIRHIAKASDVFAEKHGLSPWEMAKKTFAHHPAHCVCDNCINARSKWDYV